MLIRIRLTKCKLDESIIILMFERCSFEVDAQVFNPVQFCQSLLGPQVSHMGTLNVELNESESFVLLMFEKCSFEIGK